MSRSLEFMLKELSHYASCDICCNQLEFSDYHLVYYNYVDDLAIIYSADTLYGTLVPTIYRQERST